MIVISDATPLIALAKLGRLALLQELFGQALIAEAVYDEVAVHAPDRPGAAEVRQAKWIQHQGPSDQMKVDYLRADLDWGEAETLVLAEELAADWVLLDEPKARLAAEMIGLKFVGTLGIFLVAKRLGKIEAIRPLLDELRAKKFYLSDKVCNDVLNQASE